MSQLRLTVAQGHPQWVLWSDAGCLEGYGMDGSGYTVGDATHPQDTNVSDLEIGPFNNFDGVPIPWIGSTGISWAYGKIVVPSTADVGTGATLTLNFADGSFVCGVRVIDDPKQVEVFITPSGSVSPDESILGQIDMASHNTAVLFFVVSGMVTNLDDEPYLMVCVDNGAVKNEWDESARCGIGLDPIVPIGGTFSAVFANDMGELFSEIVREIF